MDLIYDFVFNIGVYMLLAVLVICTTTIICVAITFGRSYANDDVDVDDEESAVITRTFN